MSVIQAILRTTAPLAAAAAMTLSAPAPAQVGELAGFTESMQREYLHRDLVIFTDSLELDRSQRDILEGLFDDYRTSFDEGITAMQQRLRDMKQELQAGDQRRILSMIFVPFEEWTAERRRLGEEFMSNFQLILNDEQHALWPAFERRLVREKTMSKGVLSGESTDLIRIFRRLDLSRPLVLTMQPILNDYEVTLDEALRARNEMLRASQAKMVESIQVQDADLSLSLVDRQLRTRLRIREVNDRYVDLIAASLPGDYSDEFRLMSREESYPRAYRPTMGERFFAAAAASQDLDPEVIEAILDLQEAHQAELEHFRTSIVRLTREHEPKQLRARVEMFAARMKGETVVRQPDPTLAEMRRRDSLDDRYIEMLRSLLTDEEFKALPGADRWLKRQQRIEARNKRGARGESKFSGTRQMKTKGGQNLGGSEGKGGRDGGGTESKGGAGGPRGTGSKSDR